MSYEPGGPAGEDPVDLPDFHRSTRMPLDAVVRLHFEGTVAYQNGFAANVSATGMYVKHPDPPPVGTQLVFEFVIGDERKPVQGAGVVSWSREKYDGPGRAAGVGIQFTEIDALSRQHIAEALFAYLESQLGEELAAHPEVRELVETSSSQTPIELIEGIGRDEIEATPAAEPVVEREPSPKLGLEMPSPSRPFRIFDEAAAPAGDEDRHGEAGEDLFTPAVPPDETDLSFGRGASGRRTRNLWPLLIGVSLALGAFALWWFLLGPGSEPVAPTPAPAPTTTSAPLPKPKPQQPALSAEPGPATSLAAAVGAREQTAPEPSATARAGTEEAAPPQAGSATGAPAAASAQPSAVASPGAAPASPTALATSATSTVTPAGRLGRVMDVAFEEGGNQTVVVVTGDGPFAAGTYKWNEIRDANPRVLVRIFGVAEAFDRSLVPAGTPELKQIRSGYHPGSSGSDLHLVLDLGSGDVRVAAVETSGDELLIRLQR